MIKPWSRRLAGALYLFRWMEQQSKRVLKNTLRGFEFWWLRPVTGWQCNELYYFVFVFIFSTAPPVRSPTWLSCCTVSWAEQSFLDFLAFAWWKQPWGRLWDSRPFVTTGRFVKLLVLLLVCRPNCQFFCPLPFAVMLRATVVHCVMRTRARFSLFMKEPLSSLWRRW